MMNTINQQPVIDFHSHILPGMDDGSESVDMSIRMLKEMQGVDICVATPHFYGYRENAHDFLLRRSRSLEALKQCLISGLPEIWIGAEVALYSGLTDLPDAVLDTLCIEGTKCLLLELPYNQWTAYETDMVATLSLDRGYRILLAHLDRYFSLQREKTALQQLLELPLCVQVNAGSLLSLQRRKTAVSLIKNRGMSLLGSDCHNMDTRKPNLMDARHVLQKKLGDPFLAEMDALGARLLANDIHG